MEKHCPPFYLGFLVLFTLSNRETKSERQEMEKIQNSNDVQKGRVRKS
jgi:hypothetical protein